MRIAAGIVSYEGYHQPEANRQLLDLWGRALQAAAERGADMVCFPAGYLFASGEDERDRLAQRAAGAAERFAVGVALGIDLSVKKLGTDYRQRIRENRLPWFVACWSPEKRVLHRWRQRSTNNRDCRAASDRTCAEQ